MASSDSQIDKPQRGCPKRAELPDININTGAQSINTERTSLTELLDSLKRRLLTILCSDQGHDLYKLLTSELHIGHDDLLTNALQRVLLFKQLFVLRPF